VIRVPGRIGLTKSNDPELIEHDLMRLVDKSHWHNIAYVFKEHGHKVCQSRIPICSKCIINDICKRNGVAKSK
jgi:endonuclease-3